MNESILKALMRLFAIVANVDEEGLSPHAREVVYNYLILQLNQELANEYILFFDEYLQLHHQKKGDERKARKKMSLNSVKVLAICNEINEELQQSEKIIVVLRLLEFISSDTVNEEEFDFVTTVADVFNIPREEFLDISSLIIRSCNEIQRKENLLIIDNKPVETFEEKPLYHYIQEQKIDDKISMLYLNSINLILLLYRGNDVLLLNNFTVLPGHVYFFDNGSVLKGSKISALYYTDILSRFRKFEDKDKIYFCANEIEYKFGNSANGLRPFSINEESGRLVAIMGGSGVGKSTLLNILIGNIKVDGGNIKINGYDLYEENKALNGLIGFVPQDDLLIEELSVFQNLYFNAKLCFRDLDENQILEVVNRTLGDLDLLEIKNLKVGNPLNKFISGGQRKRLNIALELIREPSILFADEPTSGLSSADSEVVMSLLKELTYKGKLIFVNIHQPSSDIFKLFDKIIILDKGGYPVFYGNPIDALVYFRKANRIANSEDAICPTCGNVNPEQVLELIENKVVNEFGRLTDKRKFTPEKWYTLFKDYTSQNKVCNIEHLKKLPLPQTMFKKATPIKQFFVFTVRNLLQKITNLQYILLNVLEAPVLAVILAFFSKYIKGTPEDPNKYIFLENVNIPSFMFMAVTVCLFLGLSVSAEEIIKDRKILNREKFLNLSHWAYLNSKMVFLIGLAAVQTFLFVIISNSILEIHGLTFKFWIILFTSAVWANVVGLIISSALNSIITIYISIPLILIPQLLFSGTVIDFNKLHKTFASNKFSPLIGDIMVSRWTYEALMVTQYTDNLYEKHFYEIEKKMENATYYSTSYYDKLEEIANYIVSNKNKDEKIEIVKRRIIVLQIEIEKVEKITNKEYKAKDKITFENFDRTEADNLIEYLYINLKKKNNALLSTYRNQKDSLVHALEDELGTNEKLVLLKESNFNAKIEDFVCNKLEFDNIKENETELVRRYKPVYQIPESNIGRAQFYSAEKVLFGFSIKTIWYNTGFIWLFTFVLYILLVLKVFDVNSSLVKKTKKSLRKK